MIGSSYELKRVPEVVYLCGMLTSNFVHANDSGEFAMGPPGLTTVLARGAP